MKSENGKRLFSVVAMATSFSAFSHAASAQFFDGNFNAGWSQLKIVDTTANQAATVTAVFVPTGGDPGAYRQTTHNYGGGSLFVAHLSSQFYTPKGYGALVTYSYDLRELFVGPPDQNQAVGYAPLLFQNNTYYRGPIIDNIFLDLPWPNFGMTNLPASSFIKIRPTDPGPANPDFSCAASQHKIQLGYISANSNAKLNQTRISGIDNWKVDFHPFVLDPDFTLVGTSQAGNSATFSLRATAVPLPANAGFYWLMSKFNFANQNWSFGPLNPQGWWPMATVNDFIGYNGITNSSSLSGSNPGVFKQGDRYRITRGVWAPCMPTQQISKFASMCSGPKMGLNC